MGETPGRRQAVDRMVQQMIKSGSSPDQARKIAIKEAKKADQKGK